MEWELREAARNVHVIRTNVKRDDSLWVLLISDLHWDNPHCDRALLKRHLDEAKKHNSPIIVVGDLFCLMQGKYDRRSSKDEIRPEHQHGDYFDRIVETAVDWFEPYKKQLAVIGYGNHETSIKSHHEIDVLDRTATMLRDRGGITRTGGYGGFVRFLLSRGMGQSRSLTMYYHHGFGGGGPVTRGTIDWSRYIMAADADIFCSGHVHYRNRDELPCVSITNQNKLQKRSRHFIRCGTYKDDYGDGHGGWHVEKGRGPRPLGGWWLRTFSAGKTPDIKVVFQETDS